MSYSDFKFNSTSDHHNLELLSSYMMESDCKDYTTVSNPDSGQVDITKLFHQLSSQITPQYTQLREHFLSTTQKISTDFQKLTQDHEDDKFY